MKEYFKNLATALCGNDPYRKELDRVKKDYEKTAERVKQLDDMFYSAKQKQDDAESALAEYGRKLSDAEAMLAERLEQVTEARKELGRRQGEVSSLQTLVENLRERNAEKDATIASMNKDFQERTDGYKRRIEGYSEQIARLQGELAKVKKRKARTPKAKEQAKEPKES